MTERGKAFIFSGQGIENYYVCWTGRLGKMWPLVSELLVRLGIWVVCALMELWERERMERVASCMGRVRSGQGVKLES